MNLFINNLPWSTSEDEIHSLLSQYGEVSSVKIITDKMTGRSKGFGFAEMPDDSAARNAIDGLNGYNLNGRNINVNEARPRTERRDRY